MLEGHCRLRVCASATALFHALPSKSCRYHFQRALLHEAELLGVQQRPWDGKSRGQEETSLTCLLLPGRALQSRGGSEDLTPFLRVIDDNFLERPFIPGLQTSSEYLWRISSIASLMGSGHRGRKGITEGFYFFLFKATACMEMSLVTGINISRSYS